MAIEVNSAGWTGQGDTPKPAPQVCGVFHDHERMNDAIMRLTGSFFDRSQVSVRVPGREEEGSYASGENPVGEDDARNLRTLATSATTAGAAMAAAGVVIATGGAALPAVAAAAAAGGATLAAGEVAGAAATQDGKTEQEQAAEAGGAVVMVSADTPERQAKAEQILRANGATRVWRQGTTKAAEPGPNPA